MNLINYFPIVILRKGVYEFKIKQCFIDQEASNVGTQLRSYASS